MAQMFVTAAPRK